MDFAGHSRFITTLITIVSLSRSPKALDNLLEDVPRQKTFSENILGNRHAQFRQSVRRKNEVMTLKLETRWSMLIGSHYVRHKLQCLIHLLVCKHVDHKRQNINSRNTNNRLNRFLYRVVGELDESLGTNVTLQIKKQNYFMTVFKLVYYL